MLETKAIEEIKTRTLFSVQFFRLS